MAIINLSLQGADKAQLLAIGEKNVRFVMAKTLTQTAQAIQADVKQHIRKTFVLRRPNFEKSIKVFSANKQTLEAKVFTMAGFATLQQMGGKQTAKDGRLAVPDYRDLHQIKSGRKSNPAGSFLMKLKSGGQVIATRQDKDIRILYYLKNLSYVPKRLNMLEIGEDRALRQVPLLFRENLHNIP